ncbi:MAG: hypothetical protein ACOH2A_14910 [Sphingobacteriaceae bacterium]
MKIIIFSFLLVLSSSIIYAQNVDSLTYQLQRKKVNGLLTTRTQKFGQYTNSLTERTGIFGLQTKKDIRRSNEILIAIVKTDNNIFKELKVLLDYRTNEQSRVQNQSQESENRNIAYMNTINKLRNQNDALSADLEQVKRIYNKQQVLFVIIILLSIVCVFVIFRRKTIKNI